MKLFIGEMVNGYDIHMHPRMRASKADGIKVGLSLVPTPRLMAFIWYGSSFPANAAKSSFFSKPVACSIGSGNSENQK